MQTIEELREDSLIEQIAHCSTSPAISAGDDRLASIRGFESVFKQVSRTPAIIRMLLQNEFEFVGQVNAMTKKENHADLLEKEWYPSTFVVPNFSDMPNWVKKFSGEAEAGRTVVAIIPARTNTNWFHDFVVAKADEIRFIKGRLTFPGHKNQSPFPDIVAVYKGKVSRRRNGQSVLDVSCKEESPETPDSGIQREVDSGLDVRPNKKQKVAIMHSFTSGVTELNP